LKVVRRLSYLALTLAYLQIVFGAIVRITGSGLGCGDTWPDCFGSFTPGERGLALEQYSLLKSLNYELAQKLFAAIYKDKILDAGK